MIEIEVYDRRDPRAVRINFGKKIFIINEHGLISEVGYIDWDGEVRDVKVVVAPQGRGS